nr:hypothetical protein CFP56_75447 [Quercus suber]
MLYGFGLLVPSSADRWEPSYLYVYLLADNPSSFPTTKEETEGCRWCCNQDRHSPIAQLATPVFGQTATQPTGKTPQERRPVNQSVIIGSQVASASSGPSTGADHIPLPEDPKAKAQAPKQDEDSSEEEEGTKSLETTELSQQIDSHVVVLDEENSTTAAIPVIQDAT